MYAKSLGWRSPEILIVVSRLGPSLDRDILGAVVFFIELLEICLLYFSHRYLADRGIIFKPKYTCLFS